MKQTITVVVILILLLSASYAYAYPSEVPQKVKAKWGDLYLSVCIQNIGDKIYEELTIKAINTWKSAWSHFTYFNSPSVDGCDIDITLLKYAVGEIKDRGSYGSTKITYWTNGHITAADITIPTATKSDVEQNGYCCKVIIDNIPHDKFYLTILHEFGHALGLGHAKDTGMGKVDIMTAYLYENKQYIISMLDIGRLDIIYGMETEFEDQLIGAQSKSNITIDKSVYNLGDNITVTGENVDAKGRVMLFKIKSEADIKWLTYAPEYVLGSCIPKYCVFVEPEDSMFEIRLNAPSVGSWVLLTYFDSVDVIQFSVGNNYAVDLGETLTLIDDVIVPNQSTSNMRLGEPLSPVRLSWYLQLTYL